MKFLCDRCKTRYSIGDDRVRGKILKIRCKNCANVITVREGMTADEPGASGRQKKVTTASPPVIDSSPANGKNALGAAFADAMTKPPPALEEEWYVSIDGDQSGPFSLAEAQRWVSQKAYDAELYCWSEGFDDWLPVDKVSHFRGLRKKPAPPASPPPLPRITPAAGRATAAAAAAPRVEEEPKPLFAATMASLEKSVQPSNPAIAIPSIAQPLAPARATPPGGTPAIQAKTNGAPSLAKGSATSGAVRNATRQGVAAPAANPFDASDAADSQTTIEPAPFQDELATAAEPVAARRADPFLRSGPAARANAAAATKPDKRDRNPAASDAAITTPHMPAAATVPNGKPAIADEDIDGDGELDIGEVSRVVNLADLARSVPRNSDRATGPATARRSGPIPGAVDRLTNSNPALRGTASVPRIAPSDIPPSDGSEPGQPLHPQMVARSHRRGMIMLLSVAGVLLLGVAGAVILLLSTDDDPVQSGLGGEYKFDPTRPEDPITHRPIETPNNPFTPSRPTNTRPWHPGSSSGGTNTHQTPEEPLPGNTIRADEIEDVARKYQGTTQRCYMRAQRGANSILIGEVKKISVTLTIDKDGSVSGLQLSDHAGDDLGKCLTASIRGWKFRQSPGGTFKFSLNFVDG